MTKVLGKPIIMFGRKKKKSHCIHIVLFRSRFVISNHVRIFLWGEKCTERKKRDEEEEEMANEKQEQLALKHCDHSHSASVYDTHKCSR